MSFAKIPVPAIEPFPKGDAGQCPRQRIHTDRTGHPPKALKAEFIHNAPLSVIDGSRKIAAAKDGNRPAAATAGGGKATVMLEMGRPEA